MIDLRRAFKDYRASGALSALVGIEAAIDEHTFATRGGDLVIFLGMRGVDYECLDAGQTEGFARRFESAARVFDERFRIYQYQLKREHPGLPAQAHANPVVAEAVANRLRHLASASKRLYSLDSYMAVVYEGWRPRNDAPSRFSRWFTHPVRAARKEFSAEATASELVTELDFARELLKDKTNNFVAQLRDAIDIRILDRHEAFRLMRLLLNYAPGIADPIGLRGNHFIDIQACSSHLECHRDYLRLDDHYVQVLTLKEPPAQTFAHVLRGLTELDCACVIASEWKRESAAKIRHLIDSKRRHFHNSKTALAAYLSANAQSAPGDRLVDNAAVAMVGDLGACLEEIEVHGRYFGEFSFTVILYHTDPAALRRAVAQCLKVFASCDAHLIEERYNRLNAWLAVLPGNAAYNVRRMWLLDTNYTDLSFLYALDPGNPRNEHLGAEYLAVLEGSGGVPYFLNLHHQDVAHTLVLGATGSGKSFLLNFLLTHLQKYEPLTYLFDLGGSYESLTRLFGGSYLPIGREERPFTINPFCLPPTPENLLFLFAWVRVLIESGGHRMCAEEEQDLYEQIENLYTVAPEQRRLFTLANIVARTSRQQLQKWVRGGPYAGLFDHAEDTLTLSPFQTFDFEGMDKALDQVEPLLFYILHRASAAINDPAHPGRFKVFVMDEAWRFFRHPVIKTYIIEALKTWRKKNAAMILATQSSDDLLHSEMLSVVTESCPTRLFLANPGMDRDAYRRAFHLNETETELIARLVPKQQVLFKQPDRAKLLNLSVDRKEYWIYTNNPPDNERKRAAFARYGFEEGLNQLARETA